ncbi:MAG: VWA domain-containing protein, partial [Planctomycetes bacterium]|nr:VWA domain-containing protein [Planctomycetota bacterium]
MNATGLLAFLGFDSPRYLFLLITVPLLVWFSFRSLAGLGRIRRVLAIAMRCIVVTCMILALAGLYRVQTHDMLGVIFAIDRSSSIAPDVQQQLFRFIQGDESKGIKGAQDFMQNDDQMAVIAFDGTSAIEQLPMGSLGIDAISEPVLPNQTNIAGSLRMAMALFPINMMRRLVVLSDGNENIGQLLEEADWFAANNIPIDVLPARYEHNDEIVFERLVAPARATTEETINLQMVL